MNDRTEALCAQAIQTLKNKAEEEAKGRPFEDSIQLVEAKALAISRGQWRVEAQVNAVDAKRYRSLTELISEVQRTRRRVESVRISPIGDASPFWDESLTDRDSAAADLVNACLALEYPELASVDTDVTATGVACAPVPEVEGAERWVLRYRLAGHKAPFDHKGFVTREGAERAALVLGAWHTDREYFVARVTEVEWAAAQ